jgi:type IV secretory pathway TrbD component
MFALLSRLPQPLKALYWAFFVVFAANLVTFFFGGDRAMALVRGLLGMVAALVGLSLGTNLNGSAEALTEVTKSYRPFGVDYSRSRLASVRFSRLFGLMMLVVGVAFIAEAAAQL